MSLRNKSKQVAHASGPKDNPTNPGAVSHLHNNHNQAEKTKSRGGADADADIPDSMPSFRSFLQNSTAQEERNPLRVVNYIPTPGCLSALDLSMDTTPSWEIGESKLEDGSTPPRHSEERDAFGELRNHHSTILDIQDPSTAVHDPWADFEIGQGLDGIFEMATGAKIDVDNTDGPSPARLPPTRIKSKMRKKEIQQSLILYAGGMKEYLEMPPPPPPPPFPVTRSTIELPRPEVRDDTETRQSRLVDETPHDEAVKKSTEQKNKKPLRKNLAKKQPRSTLFQSRSQIKKAGAHKFPSKPSAITQKRLRSDSESNKKQTNIKRARNLTSLDSPKMPSVSSSSKSQFEIVGPDTRQMCVVDLLVQHFLSTCQNAQVSRRVKEIVKKCTNLHNQGNTRFSHLPGSIFEKLVPCIGGPTFRRLMRETKVFDRPARLQTVTSDPPVNHVCTYIKARSPETPPVSVHLPCPNTPTVAVAYGMYLEWTGYRERELAKGYSLQHVWEQGQAAVQRMTTDQRREFLEFTKKKAKMHTISGSDSCTGSSSANSIFASNQ